MPDDEQVSQGGGAPPPQTEILEFIKQYGQGFADPDAAFKTFLDHKDKENRQIRENEDRDKERSHQLELTREENKRFFWVVGSVVSLAVGAFIFSDNEGRNEIIKIVTPALIGLAGGMAIERTAKSKK